MAHLANYKPFWPETSILLGAGAMADLGVPTTYQMGRAIRRLAESGGNKSMLERVRKLSIFYGVEMELGNFLTTVGDGLEKEGASFVKESIVGVGKILPDYFSEEKIRERILEWKVHYDWDALRRLAIKVPVQNGNYSTYMVDLYNLIDGNLFSGCGVQVKDASGELIFLPPQRLRAARNLLVLLSNLMMACAYHKIRMECPKKFEPYLGFIEASGELAQRETIDLECLEYSKRIFYLMSSSVISFNFDPIFFWLRFTVNSEILNKKSPHIGRRNLPVKLHHDFSVFGETKSTGKEAEGYYLTNETVAKRNNGDDDCGRLYRICKFYCVHGNTNIRECGNCGKMLLNLGKWDIISEDLFSPPPFKTNLFEREPFTKEESDARRDGKYDAIQCPFCGNMTYAYNNTMVMQTTYKGDHPSFLEEIQRDAKVSLSGAKHIILLGYQLPPDDAIWRSALVAKRNDRDVYCSVVVGCLGEDRWIESEELEEYVKDRKKNIEIEKWADHGINAIDAAIAIFEAKNVRAYTGGIPRVWCSGGSVVDKDKVKNLLYPTRVFPDGVANMRIKSMEK